jgi:DNA-binding MarR family transcriptional regulator
MLGTDRTSHDVVAARMRLAVLRLARRLRQQAAGSDLSPSMLSALSSVERFEPITLGDLAAAERVQPPTMTKIVARLEEAGLVLREPDPVDGRVSRVRLSRAGRRQMASNRSRKDAYLVGLLRTLPDADVRKLADAMTVLEKVLEDRR